MIAIGFAAAAVAAAEQNAAVADPKPRVEKCPWCDIFVRSAAGMCSCKDACGSNTCPARNADGYTPPPVPKFARPREAGE